MINRIDKLVQRIEEVALAFSIIIMSLILIGNVILRLFFKSSLNFAEELGQILLMIVTFVGTSYAVRKGNHIRISVLHENSKPKIKKILALVISFISSLTMFWLSYIAWGYVLDLYHQYRFTPVLHIPVYMFTSVIGLGFSFSAIQYMHIFYLNIINEGIYVGKQPQT